MPELTRPGGARIHYELLGEGRPILQASYWSWVPGTYDEVLGDLRADHTVATYHLRGTGQSSPEGPFDMQTDAGDLEALAEQLGEPAILVSTADSSNRAVEVAARRPELVAGVICFGAAPFALRLFKGGEGLVGSETVIGAFIEMLESNYRGAMRTFMEATNPQMSSDELRDRVSLQADFCDAEAAAERLRSWLADDPTDAAQAIGDRLCVFAAGNVAGPWLPPGPEVARLTRETLPQARIVDLEPGPVSNPGGTADAIRRVAAELS